MNNSLLPSGLHHLKLSMLKKVAHEFVSVLSAPQSNAAVTVPTSVQVSASDDFGLAVLTDDETDSSPPLPLPMSSLTILLSLLHRSD